MSAADVRIASAVVAPSVDCLAAKRWTGVARASEVMKHVMTLADRRQVGEIRSCLLGSILGSSDSYEVGAVVALLADVLCIASAVVGPEEVGQLAQPYENGARSEAETILRHERLRAERVSDRMAKARAAKAAKRALELRLA